MEINISKPVVLVGIMGAGKTTVGSKLAKAVSLPFYDIDQEIEKIACCSVADIFFYAGEKYFRKVELQVAETLLNKNKPMIIATGGGSFVNPVIHKLIKEKALSIWLKAEVEVLADRVIKRKGARPLIEGQSDTKKLLSDLLIEREAIYEKADIAVGSENKTHGQAVKDILSALLKYFNEKDD